MRAAEREAFASTLLSIAPLDTRELAAVFALCTTARFDEGTWILRGGERAEHCYFILRGLVRELYVGENGEEHTRVFVREQQITGSLLDLISGAPSVTWIQALEPTEAIKFRYRDIDALAARHLSLQVVLRRVAEALYVRKARREHDMLALSAGERYRRFAEEHRELDARISRRHLASYLGVTPEHLSRLRRSAAKAPAR